jgi:hypothetical protein
VVAIRGAVSDDCPRPTTPTLRVTVWQHCRVGILDSPTIRSRFLLGCPFREKEHRHNNRVPSSGAPFLRSKNDTRNLVPDGHETTRKCLFDHSDGAHLDG